MDLRQVERSDDPGVSGSQHELSPSGTHTAEQLNDIEAHICNACKARFTRIEHLKRHITSIHSGQNVKPHTCQFCKKGFSRRDVLLRHHQSCRSAIAGASVLVSRRAKRACRTCKELKLKCTGGPRCEKCKGLGHDCVFPEPHKIEKQIPSSPTPASGDEGHTSDPSFRGNGALTNKSHSEADFDYQHEADSHRRSMSFVAPESAPVEKKTASKRGRYVSKACINCQKRKVKCSGEEPCLHCRSGVLECVYSRTRKRRSIAAVEMQDPPILTPETTAQEAEAAEALSAMTRLAKLEHEFRMFKHQSGIQGDYDTISISYDSEHEQMDDEETSPHSYPTPSTILDPKDMFQGGSSLYEPLRVLSGADEVAGDASAAENASTAWQNLQRTHKTDMGVMEHETRSDMPLIRHSVDIYFSYLNPHYPILNENQFRTNFEAFANKTHQSKTADRCQFVALINLMHAIVQILHDTCLDPKTAPGWHEFCRAENILSQVIGFGGEGNILTLQCLFLKSHYLLYLEKGDSACDTMGRVVHLCFLLRLHHQAAWIGCSDYEVHMRQRIFWTVFNQDRILAINCGVPYLIRDSDFNVDFPKSFDDKLLSPNQPLPEESPEHSANSYLSCSAKWGRMGGEIWDAIFSVNAKKPCTRDSEFVITMDARLQYTASQFPPHLQWEHNIHRLNGIDDLPPALCRQSLVLHLQMNQLRLHLRQEHILTLKYDHVLAEECVSIATTSVNAIHAYYTSRYYKQTNRYSSILYLMGSLLILVCVIIKSDNDEQTRSKAIDAFKRGLAMHNELSTHFTMARHALHRMHRIIGRTQQVINSFQSEERYPLLDLGPQITDFFNSDPNWMMDLDKDIALPFNGTFGTHFHDGTATNDEMDSFWVEDGFNSREWLGHPR